MYAYKDIHILYVSHVNWMSRFLFLLFLNRLVMQQSSQSNARQKSIRRNPTMIQICEGNLYSILFLFTFVCILHPSLNELFHDFSLTRNSNELCLEFDHLSIFPFLFDIIINRLNNFWFHSRIEYVIYARNSIIRSVHLCDVEIGRIKKGK